MNEHLERTQQTGESGNTQRLEQLGGRITALWTAVVVLAVVLAGVTGYGYLALHKHGLQLKDLPGVQESVALVGERVDAVEAKLNNWASQFEAVNARLNKLDRKINYNRELAKSEARKAAEQVQERLEAEMNEKASALDARVSLLESGQEADRARLERVREEIAQVRRETGSDMGRLHGQIAQNEHELSDLARSLEPVRVDFELREDRTQELAQGVSLRITGTNVRKQQVKGWMWLMPDRKTLWVRDLGLQQAFRFYHKDGSGPHELVITRVHDKGASGYLLLQQQRAEELSAEATGADGEATGSGSPAHSGLQ